MKKGRNHARMGASKGKAKNQIPSLKRRPGEPPIVPSTRIDRSKVKIMRGYKT